MKIVIDSSFFESPEILHIKTLLGRGSEILFLRLKCRLAEMPEEAVITLSPSEIERMAGWWGVPGKMTEAFEKVGIFSFRNGVFLLKKEPGISENKAGKEKETREKEEKEKEIKKEKDKKKKTIDKEKEEKAQKEKEKAVILPDLDLFGRPVEFSDPGQTKKEPKITVYSPDFLAFWQRYPRKAGKGAAFKSWKIHRPPLNACLKAIAWQEKTDQWTRDGGQYIPHPSTWINQERWLDEPPDTERQGNRAADGKYDTWGEKV